MKRRIIVILIIAVVISGLVGGIWLYISRNTGPKLLRRAEIAIKAKKYDKAIGLVENYIEKYPDDWQGYNVKARAFNYLGRYSEARDILKKAGQLNPEEISVFITHAESYSLPAFRLLGRENAISQPEVLSEAIELLRKANGVLDGVKTTDQEQKRILDVKRNIGLNYRGIALILDAKGQCLAKEEKIAKAARNTKLATSKREASEAAIAASNTATDNAIKNLLEVVQGDATRAFAARRLVELCIHRISFSRAELRKVKSDDPKKAEKLRKQIDQDEESLDAADKAFEALEMKSRPPVPVMMLAKYKLSSSLRDAADSAARRKAWSDYCEELDKLLKDHPDVIEVKLARANAAIVLDDFGTAEQLCKEILDASPGLGRARYIKAEVLLRQGKAAEAEGILFNLMEDSLRMSDAGFIAEVHVTYARAAMATGKTELAKDAMRTATKYNPGHPLARSFLAESLIAEGHYDQAFTDAQEYYKAHPGDPGALRLYVEAARRADQPESAAEAQKKAEKNYATNPEMLLAVADGYRVMGKNRKAWEVLDKAAECKTKTTEGRIAVAQALRRTDRSSEAEKILTEELARNRNQPGVCFELGRLHSRRGRGLQAIEQFRAAVEMDGLNVRYRMALARALLNSGDMEECLNTLKQFDASNVDANLLRLQVAIFRGESDSAQQMLQQIRGSKRGGVSLAMFYLGKGDEESLKECIATCLEELRKTPDDSRIRFLLGNAFLNQGRKVKCIEVWSAMLKSAPEDLSTYKRIAAVWADELEHDLTKVRKQMIATTGAKRDLVDLAMGWLYTRRREFKAAADVYSRIITREETVPFYRRRARILRAGVTAAGGDIDGAIAELDILSKVTAWRRRALEGKVRILLIAGRRDEAVATVKQLRKIATDMKDTAAMERIVQIYMRMRLIEDALSVCDDVKKLYPNDAKSYLLRAGVLAGTGQRSQSIPLFEKAITLQPGNLTTYRTLARVLEAEQQPEKVLETLKRMEKAGRTGKAAAMFERGGFFERCGLYTQAVKTFEQLSKAGYTGVSGIQLVLGRAFGRLGQTERATDILKKIPVHSPQYVKSRQLLVELAKTDKEKLDILDGIEKDKPGRAGVLVQKMRILLGADRPADAIKAYRWFVGEYAKNRPAPSAASFLAVTAMLAGNDHPAASALAADMAEKTRAPMWRHLAILLNMDRKADSAARMLPSVEKTLIFDALLGMVLSVQKGDDASCRKWADRLDQIDRELAKLSRPISVRKRYSLLAAIIAGRLPQARKELKRFTNFDVGRTAAAELVSHAGRVGRSASAAEAAKLLKASLAIDLGLAELGREWALDVFKARPGCQWAAAVVLGQNPDNETLKFMLKNVRPRNCSLVRIIEAGLLARQKKYEEAAEVYRKAVKAEGHNPRLVYEQARMCEAAGLFDRALKLYVEVWKATQEPGAANNAAYLAAQLYPKDADRLGEALKWIDAAIKADPRVAEFRDTKGWIAFLLGKKEQARTEVRRAVAILRGSPEVHYHLGVIEADAGNRDLARWHLMAVADNASAIKSGGGELTVAEVKAKWLAKEALAGLDRKEK